MAGHKAGPAKLQHSVKVPQFYKTAANIVKRVTEEHCSLKELVFNVNKHLVSNAVMVSVVENSKRRVYGGHITYERRKGFLGRVLYVLRSIFRSKFMVLS
jgi:hypothetical protein